MASSEDGIHFTKYENNPIIAGPPEGFDPGSFRYDATGRFVKYVDGAESVNVSDLNGVYVVKLLNKQVIRSAKVVVK